ncbi:MAG: hypothetical protein KC422_17070 [Trueperaceae bacterium]|nr:hypothetical protein [Trueperaceae bacterium]
MIHTQLMYTLASEKNKEMQRLSKSYRIQQISPDKERQPRIQKYWLNRYIS